MSIPSHAGMACTTIQLSSVQGPGNFVTPEKHVELFFLGQTGGVMSQNYLLQDWYEKWAATH